MPELVLAQIKHFFENYKALEQGKWVKVGNYQGSEVAKVMLVNSVKRYKS